MQDIQNIFKNIELTGEKFKQEFKELAIKAQITIDSQTNSSKFEAAYALSVAKRQRMKTNLQVKDIRNEVWQEALKRANGNVNDASKIYENLCAFP